MTFEEYLIKKRIHVAAFAAGDPVRFAAWQQMYGQMHPNSFYVAVKMQLNNVRLRYHLAEADIPKPEPGVSAPEKPAQAAVPQQTSAGTGQKPVVKRPLIAKPVAENQEESTAEKPAATAKPVIKRPAALQKPTEEKDAIAGEQGEPSASTAPTSPRSRPVIERPAAVQQPAAEAPQATEKEIGEPANAATAPSAAKPARPRPVIKRPAALQQPEEKREENKQQPAAVASQAEATTESAPEATPGKPLRPRPVIKRPVALQKPEEEKAPEANAAQDAPTTAQPTETPAPEAAPAQSPKPPRPRPVIKRPAAAPPREGDEAKPTGQEGAGPETTPPQPATPRPRPIMRRPPPKPEEDSEGS